MMFVGAALCRPLNRFGRSKPAPTRTSRSGLDHLEMAQELSNRTGREILNVICVNSCSFVAELLQIEATNLRRDTL